MQMIGVLAELERSLIVERTQAGMKEARRRAADLVPPVKLLEKLLSAIGLGSVAFTYNMGQTLVIARRK